MTGTEITVIQGTDVNRAIMVTDSNGDPVDITGWTLFFTVKDQLYKSDSEAIISKTFTDHPDPENGESAFILSNSESNKKPGIYIYDFRAIDENGKRRNTRKGPFILEEPVTKRSS